jgi:lysophospholipase L1-like esterase
MAASRSRRLAPWLALAVLPALLLLDTASALLRGWQPRGSLHGWVGAAAVAVLAVVAWGAASPPARTARRRRAARVGLAAAALALACLAAEAAAPALGGFGARQRAHSRGHDLARLLRPDPRWITGVHGPSRYTTDGSGFRTAVAAPPGSRRIACVGGSTTECLYLDDRETWPQLLMDDLEARGLRVWVGNLGVSGLATVEHLALLERSPALDHVHCVVFLAGLNDFLRFLSGSLAVGPPPLWRRLALVEAATAWHRRHFRFDPLYEVDDLEGRNHEARRRFRRRWSAAAELPPLGAALAEYQGRLGRLAELCARRRLRCVFLTQPVLWRPGMSAAATARLWLGSDERGRFLPADRLRRGMDAYNGALLESCTRLRLECVALESMSGEERYFYDDCHFTEAGAREVARILGDYLARVPGELASG